MDFFEENLGDMSEHCERFHQDISVVERHFNRIWKLGMLEDYCWGVKIDHTPDRWLRSTTAVSTDMFFFAFNS